MKKRQNTEKFIGVDFDGTLATYDTFKGAGHLGEPIQPMVKRVKKWIKEGKIVKIFTARVSNEHSLMDIVEAEEAIKEWCKKHIGKELPMTADKSPSMYQFWDDKAVAVEKNTGKVIGEKYE